MSQPAYADHIRPASALLADRKGGTRYLPVDEHLRRLLPDCGLRRGTVVEVTSGTPGSTSLMLTLLTKASTAGSWVAIAGLPTIGFVAADELGLILARTAYVPDLGRDPVNVIGALIDGFDIVVIRTSAAIAPALRQQLAARARQRGSVLVPYGMPWDGADTTLTTVDAKWHGIGEDAGRRLTIGARGRGAGAHARTVEMWCPEPGPQWTPLPLVPEQGRTRTPLHAIGMT